MTTSIRLYCVLVFLAFFTFSGCVPEPAGPISPGSLEPVTGLKALVEGDKVSLSWDAHDAAKEYELARAHKEPAKAAASHSFAKAAQIAMQRRLRVAATGTWAGTATTAETAYTETLTKPGTYTYRVRGVSADGRISPWSEEVTISVSNEDLGIQEPRYTHPFELFLDQCGEPHDAEIPEIGFWFNEASSTTLVICKVNGELLIARAHDEFMIDTVEFHYQEGGLAISTGNFAATWTYAEVETYTEFDEFPIYTVLPVPAPSNWAYTWDAGRLVVEGVTYVNYFSEGPAMPTEPTSVAYAAAATSSTWNTAADPGFGTQLFAPGTDEDYAEIDFPFPVSFYGKPFTEFTVTTNGVIYCGKPRIDGLPMEWEIPNSFDPYMIAIAWGDLFVADTGLGAAANGRIAWSAVGSEPDRKVVVTFTNLHTFDNPSKLGSFQIEFSEGSDAFEVRYGTLQSNLATFLLAGTNYGDGESGTSWAVASSSAKRISPVE